MNKLNTSFLFLSASCSGTNLPTLSDDTAEGNSGSTADTATNSIPTGEIDVAFYVFDPSNPGDPPCFEWTTMLLPAEFWSEYANSINSISGCAFADVLMSYESVGGKCYRIPGTCPIDPTLVSAGAICSEAPDCTEGRPDF